jgi:hypothetical protein
MAENIDEANQLPDAFGGTWSKFVELWCGGQPTENRRFGGSSRIRMQHVPFPNLLSERFRVSMKTMQFGMVSAEDVCSRDFFI